jgi:hypothetical protein
LAERGDLGGRYEELDIKVQEAGKLVVSSTTKCEMHAKTIADENQSRQGLVDNLEESSQGIETCKTNLEVKQKV